jgi:hypothetical protein
MSRSPGPIVPFFALLLIAASGSGCASVDSSDVLTSGIYPNFTASTDGSGTRAEAILRVGGASSNTFVSLSGDDSLTVTADGTTTTLTQTQLGDYSVYSADLEPDAEDASFTFALVRTSDAGAPSSIASLPAPFELTAPSADSVISRADDILVSWEPSGEQDTILVEWATDCTWTYEVEVDGDTGSYSIPAADVELIDGHEDESCAGTLTVTRRRGGTLDPAFEEGGTVYGRQTRSVDLRSDP